MTILIPMAGLATRFAHEGILTPKPLIMVAGKPLIQHTLETLGFKGRYVFVTRQYENHEDNVSLSRALQDLCPDCQEVMLEQPTRGAVETCLAARHLIDPEAPLIITNCDQRTEWDLEAFMREVVTHDPDGLVVTHTSRDPKHSYAEVGLASEVIRIAEKQVISDQALVGIHYWKRGQLFLDSADAFTSDAGFVREWYVSETYNPLIESGSKVLTYQLADGQYIPLGTPYDVAIYEAKLKENHPDKPRTIFIDLDGTILKHLHRFSDLDKEARLLPGVRAKLDEWDSHGHRIILCTARKESAREMTEQHLRTLGVPYDQLIMGLTSGPRVLVNDRLSADAPARAIAISVTTDVGFGATDWGAVGL